MIQQILLQSYAYTRKRLLPLGESIIERGLANSARHIGIVKQIAHNTQKTNVDALWKEVSGKKRNPNSPEISTPHKEPKPNSQANPCILLTPSNDLRRSSMI
jgi:hypothetical protein